MIERRIKPSTNDTMKVYSTLAYPHLSLSLSVTCLVTLSFAFSRFSLPPTNAVFKNCSSLLVDRPRQKYTVKQAPKHFVKMGLPLELLKIIFTKHLQNDTNLLSSKAKEKEVSNSMLGKKGNSFKGLGRRENSESHRNRMGGILFR